MEHTQKIRIPLPPAREPIDLHSEKFVRPILLNALESFQFQKEYTAGVLLDCGYALLKKGKFVLVGYEDISLLIHQLAPEELKVFLFTFINEVHQAAYHVSKKNIGDYITSTMETCDVCGKPLLQSRERRWKVDEGKKVYFCSEGCQDILNKHELGMSKQN